MLFSRKPESPRHLRVPARGGGGHAISPIFPYIPYISPSPPRARARRREVMLYLRISPVYLPYISRISPVYLPYISPWHLPRHPLRARAGGGEEQQVRANRVGAWLG